MSSYGACMIVESSFSCAIAGEDFVARFLFMAIVVIIMLLLIIAVMRGDKIRTLRRMMRMKGRRRKGSARDEL